MLESKARVKIFLETASSLLVVLVCLLISTENAEGACVEPCLYYANETTLKRLQLQASSGHVAQGTKVETIYNKGKRIEPIALDHVGQRIFWSDTTTRGIYKAYLNGTGDQELIKYGIGLCQGIAYDWSTDNIYWTDSLHDWIEVASSDGKNRMVLINGSMHSPRGIAVTPFDSFVFWSDFGKNPRIERATLDGKNRRTIVTSRLVWPNDLAIDFSTKRIYWIDAYRDKIESTDYSGGGRIIHTDVSYQGAITMHPYSMTLFFKHSLAYFTDWYRSIVLYQRLQSTRVVPNIAVDGPRLIRRIGQVRLMHTSNQPPSSSQCLTNRSICSHICLKKNAADYSCACPTGMRLTQQGGRVCQKDDLDYQAFLLDGTNQNSKIFHISKYVSQAQYVFGTLKLPNSGLPVGIDFDPTSGLLYWSDVHLDKILTMSVDGSGYKALVNRNLRTPEGVAVDPASKLLYFADYGRETIEVVKLDGSARKILISSDLVNPRDIKIYHEMGLMFISDWGLNNPKIESAFLDGTGRKRVIASSIRTPSGLAIDKIENRLYWCDFGLDRIESSNFDGSDRRILFDHFGYNPYVPIDTITGEIQTAFGLALFRDRVYWTDWVTRSVYSADKRTGGKISLLSAGFIKPMQIHVYSNKTEKEFKKIYFFSHARHSPSVNFTCFQASCNLNVIEEPAMCPPGFKQTKLNTTCAKCATKFGLYGRRCPCNDWMTCAHRAYLKSSCSNSEPFMHFKVRECVQAVNPGFCPSYKCGVGASNTNNCTSDDDCHDSQKCCKTACGAKCLKSSPQPAEHPCQNKNGGCSHFCFRMPIGFNRGFTCGCPDTMILQTADNKTCIRKSGYCAVHKPCLNSGICADNAIGTYNCTCQPGYYGSRCQNRSEICISSSCQNNGNCTKVADKIKCLCSPAFTGPKCEISIVCLSKPCLHNGSCVTTAQGFVCNCPSDYTGDKCQTSMTCYPNPCQHNGQCSAVGGQVKCNCPSNYTGDKCQTSMACYPNPCQHNGQCSAVGSQVKCNCPSNYTGDKCQTSMACYPNPCQHNGQCSAVGGQVKCNCPSNYTGDKCQTSMACYPNPCQHNGQCSAVGGQVKCNCPSNYTGDKCQTSMACYPNPCQHNGQCSAAGGQAKCNCPSNYTGDKCQTSMACYPNPCQHNGQCSAVGGQAKCNCPSDYTGDKCQTSMACYPNPCQHNGQCSAVGGQVKCNCPSNYTGDKCQTSMACYPNPCQYNGQCSAAGGQAKCNCPSNYTGDKCQTSMACYPNPCQHNGQCTVVGSQVKCNCPSDYTGDKCQTSMACYPNPCQHNGQCSAVGSQVKCNCPSDYTGDKCQTSMACYPNPCQHNGQCSAVGSQVKCNCPSDYTGDKCQTSMACYPNPCQHNGQCSAVGSQVKCNCPSDYTGDKCQTSMACYPNPCRNRGQCTAVGGQAKCNCLSKYTGAHCDIKLFCVQNPCYNGGLCSEMNTTYSCQCSNGYSGRSCETPPQCMSNPCQNSGTCNTVGTDNYNCSCANGFTGKTCSIVDYCASNKCKNDAACVNSASSYTCQCSQGFTGSNCDVIIDHCVGHSCQYGAACINSKTGYTCNCAGDYTGMRCENKINDCAGVVCNNSGTCTDGIKSYHCNCKQYFTGKHCDSVVDLCHSSYVCLNGGRCRVKQPDAKRKLPYICDCSGNFGGSNCQLFYDGNLVQMALSTSVSNLPRVPEIQDILASKYTTYCAAANCGDKTSARKKRESQTAVTVSKDDVMIPTGFPRSFGGSQTEIQYAVIGQRNGVAFVLSSKVAADGLKSIKAELEIFLGAKILSFKALSQKPTGKTSEQKGGTSKSGLAAGLAGWAVAVFTVVFIVLLTFYCRKRKRRNEQSVKFSQASFDDIPNQPQSDLNSDGIVQIRNNKQTDKQNNFQFQNMMYENNELYSEGLKVDLSNSGYSAEMENKENMTGIVNPYAEVPEEAQTPQGASYVERTNSTSVLIADSPPIGLTSLDVVQEDFIKASPRSPRRSDDSGLNGILVQVQTNGLTAYENPSYGFVGSGAVADEKSDEKTRELSTNEAGSRIDESSA